MQSGGAAAQSPPQIGQPILKRHGGRWAQFETKRPSRASVRRRFLIVAGSAYTVHLSCKFPNIFSTPAAIISETNDLIAIPLDASASLYRERMTLPSAQSGSLRLATDRFWRKPVTRTAVCSWRQSVVPVN